MPLKLKIHSTSQTVELSLNTNGKACSRCNEFKSLDDFYKQGSRHESLCKACKRQAREQKKSEAIVADPVVEPPTKTAGEFDDRETMPIFDESIFYPEERCRALGLDADDIADITAFVRWHMDQREKRLKKRGK